MHFLRLLLVSAALVFVAILAGQNPEAITVRLFGWQSVPLPLGLVLAIATSLGLLTMGFGYWLWRVGKPSLSPAARELRLRLDRIESAAPPEN